LASLEDHHRSEHRPIRSGFKRHDEERSRINVSPHHQRPTKYPWPGVASAVTVVLGLAVIVVIGFILIANPFANDPAEPAPTSMSGAAGRGL
jgi:hypothetical protein